MRNALFLRLRATAILTTILTVTAGALLTPLPAGAQQHGGHAGGGHVGAWHGGPGWHGGWGWGWGVGLGVLAADAAFWGWPYYWGYPYYPYPYYAPYYYPPASSVTVIEPGPAQAAPAPPAYYYCTNPKGYYPYVASCQVPWQAVPVVPPAGGQ